MFCSVLLSTMIEFILFQWILILKRNIKNRSDKQSIKENLRKKIFQMKIYLHFQPFLSLRLNMKMHEILIILHKFKNELSTKLFFFISNIHVPILFMESKFSSINIWSPQYCIYCLYHFYCCLTISISSFICLKFQCMGFRS